MPAKHHAYSSRFDFVAEHARGTWHFDPQRLVPGDLRVLGRIHGDWAEALKRVRFKPRFSCRSGGEAGSGASWDRVFPLVQAQEKNSDDVRWDSMHAQDLARWGYRPENVEHETHDGELPEVFKKIGASLPLKDCHIDLNRQRPGQMTPVHTDTRLHEYGLQRVYDGDFTKPTFVRLLIALAPWDWGHYCFIGNGVWHQWRSGEMAMIPWQVLHGTANCGRYDRYFLSVTGCVTPEFEAWVSGGEIRDLFL
jgi:hypothetical protein